MAENPFQNAPPYGGIRRKLEADCIFKEGWQEAGKPEILWLPVFKIRNLWFALS